MNIGRMNNFTNDWFRSPRVDFDIALPECFQYAPSIEGSLFERCVAVDGADS